MTEECDAPGQEVSMLQPEADVSNWFIPLIPQRLVNTNNLTW